MRRDVCFCAFSTFSNFFYSEYYFLTSRKIKTKVVASMVTLSEWWSRRPLFLFPSILRSQFFTTFSIAHMNRVTGVTLKTHTTSQNKWHVSGGEGKGEKVPPRGAWPQTLHQERDRQGLELEKKQGLVLTKANLLANLKCGFGSSGRGSCVILSATGLLLNICSVFCKCCHLKLCYFNG